jgi:predicted phosphodiesterase
MRVGLVADTHGLADPRLERLFRGCALILHAGDVTGPAVLEALAAIAPVRTVRGNNDLGPFGDSLPLTCREDLGALSALVVHEPGRRGATRPRPAPPSRAGGPTSWSTATRTAPASSSTTASST